MKVLFVAEHGGPYQTLRALADAAPPGIEISYALGAAASKSADPTGLLAPPATTHLPDRAPDALVIGTSETAGEPNIETVLGRSASQKGIPVYALEDFPLNFQPVPGLDIEGLFVEFDDLDRYRRRGINPEIVRPFGNPRYAAMAAQNRTIVGPSQCLTTAHTVLWAGQPDNGVSFQTLSRLLPHLLALNVGIYFRAHPRDRWYARGEYQSLMAGTPWRDITAEPSVWPWVKASQLIVTQFSTVAVESAYLGVPGLFVLYPDLGASCMQQFKGHTWLPWVDRRCAFSLQEIERTPEILRRSILDEKSRHLCLENAQSVGKNNIESARKIWTEITSQ